MDIQQLPREILVMIFGYLSYRDLTRIKFVCRLFYFLAIPLKRHHLAAIRIQRCWNRYSKFHIVDNFKEAVRMVHHKFADNWEYPIWEDGIPNEDPGYFYKFPHVKVEDRRAISYMRTGCWRIGRYGDHLSIICVYPPEGVEQIKIQIKVLSYSPYVIFKRTYNVYKKRSIIIHPFGLGLPLNNLKNVQFHVYSNPPSRIAAYYCFYPEYLKSCMDDIKLTNYGGSFFTIEYGYLKIVNENIRKKFIDWNID